MSKKNEPEIEYEIPEAADELPELLLVRLEQALFDEPDWCDMDEVLEAPPEDRLYVVAEKLIDHLNEELDDPDNEADWEGNEEREAAIADLEAFLEHR